MKVTKYFQSCLLVEEQGSSILIDPSGAEKDRIAEFGDIDAVLYTHEHGDHFDPGVAGAFLAKNIPVYANASTSKLISGAAQLVEDGSEFKVGEVSVRAIELPHCLMPNGQPGPQNTGYLIARKLFHPGDGKELKDLAVENVALPITGPDISFYDAVCFVSQLGAKNAIAIHYHTMGANTDTYQYFMKLFNLDFNLLTPNVGESVEINSN